MKNRYIPFLCIAAISFTSCVTPAYYLSPFNTNSNYYHTIPLHSDSVKSATYASAVFLGGGSNYHWQDGIVAFQGGIHRSNNFGRFQAYYGANITLGTYHVVENDRYNYHYNPSPAIFPSLPIQDSVPYFRIPDAIKFFGAYGFNGGINYVVPFKRGGEWRIGIETSVHNEFGNYLSFRKSLPDSAIDILEKSNWTKTLGGYFDFVWKRDKVNIVGYKMAIGGSFVSRNTYLGSQNNIRPAYFSQTIHFTHRNYTWFWQTNFGTYSASVQLGVNYKLGHKSK